MINILSEIIPDSIYAITFSQQQDFPKAKQITEIEILMEGDKKTLYGYTVIQKCLFDV